MKRVINLLNYLPEFMKEYREIKHIAGAENPEFNSLADISETVRNNQFIESCNEAGISRYEKMLGIQPGNGESLEVRIGRVWSKWIDTIPYTLRALKNKLDILLGENNHSEEIDYDNYTVSVTINFDVSDRAKIVNELLDDIVPANMVYDTVYVGKQVIEFISEIHFYQTSLPPCGKYSCGQTGRYF